MSEAGYVLLGTLIPLLFNLIQSWINTHYEQTRHLQKLMLDNAFNQWKENRDFAKLALEKGLAAEVDSFTTHLIFSAFLTNAVSRGNIEPKSIIEAVKSAREVVAALSAVEHDK